MEIVVVGIVCAGVFLLKWVVENMNWWLYEKNLASHIRYELPPGDLGWPYFGNMFSFNKAFKSPNPESFLATFVNRFTLLTSHTHTHTE